MSLEQNTKLRVVVVGGGIGGLFAADALYQQDIDVHVYEQAPELTEVGAGVQLTPNGVKQLHRIGLATGLDELAALDTDRSHFFRSDGTPVAPVTASNSEATLYVRGVHRADLIDLLARELPSDRVHTGYRCDAFEQDENIARVHFENGVTVEADVVIGADGLHSLLQEHIVTPAAPLYSGSVAYRGLVPHQKVPWWPRDEIQVWMGMNRHFLTYPVRRGDMVNYVAFIPADEGLAESWSSAGDPTVLTHEFAGWDERVTGLLEELEVVYGLGLYDREPLTHWVRGRLALLGDAAHPMLPHLGQGANQAIEDGMALATLLSTVGRDRPQQALALYEGLRRERTSAVQTGARENGKRFASMYNDLSVRDAELAASREFSWWLYDYDVAAEADNVAARSAAA
jgi:salicylate hydroxylase